MNIILPYNIYLLIFETNDLYILLIYTKNEQLTTKHLFFWSLLRYYILSLKKYCAYPS